MHRFSLLEITLCSLRLLSPAESQFSKHSGMSLHYSSGIWFSAQQCSSKTQCQLPRHRHDRFLLTPTISQHPSELLQQHRIVSDSYPRRLHQPPPHRSVSLLGNMSSMLLVTAGVLAGHQTQKAGELLFSPKPAHMPPFQCQPDRCQHADTRSTHQ